MQYESETIEAFNKKKTLMIDAEQDFGSDDEDANDDEEQNERNKHALLDKGEWSPKQYSVSSNNEDEDEAVVETGAAEKYFPRNHLPQSDEEDEYGDVEYQDSQQTTQGGNFRGNPDDSSVLREILNGASFNYAKHSGSDEEEDDSLEEEEAREGFKKD